MTSGIGLDDMNIPKTGLVDVSTDAIRSMLVEPFEVSRNN